MISKKNDLGMLLLLWHLKILLLKAYPKMIELVKLIKYSDDFDTIIESATQNIDKLILIHLLNKYCCGDILINK